MIFDKAVHYLFKNLNSIRWHDFAEVGVDYAYAVWYHAEDRLYIIRDVMLDNYWFIKASSPGDALKQCQDRMEEASHAGEWVPEELE